MNNVDKEHLRYLAIAYYVIAALKAFAAVVMLVVIAVFLGLGLIGAAAASSQQGSGGAAAGIVAMLGTFGCFFAVIGVFTLGVAYVSYLVGRRLDEQRSHTFCFVFACITCLYFPVGTVLGILTIIVLNRPSAKALFDANDGRGF